MAARGHGCSDSLALRQPPLCSQFLADGSLLLWQGRGVRCFGTFPPACGDGGFRVMKNGPLFFLGLFAALIFSWAGILLGSHAQLGSLTPYYDDAESKAFPERVSGL